jgi:drug/metabolite transporter (DMT)-like permease
LGATLMPFALTLFASKHAEATVVAMVGYLAPLVAVVAGVVILGEHITPVILAGGALAVVGVALVGGTRRTQT